MSKQLSVSVSGKIKQIREIPEPVYISSDAVELYRLENLRNKALAEAADEQARVMGFSESEYWSKTIPHALLSVLNAYERAAVMAAIVGYLRADGLTVEVREEA